MVDPHRSGTRGELGIAVGLLHGEVADAGPELHRPRLVELDIADAGLVAALAEATERLKAGEEQAFEEQRRLHSAREKVKERLASLAGTD